MCRDAAANFIKITERVNQAYLNNFYRALRTGKSICGVATTEHKAISTRLCGLLSSDRLHFPQIDDNATYIHLASSVIDRARAQKYNKNGKKCQLLPRAVIPNVIEYRFNAKLRKISLTAAEREKQKRPRGLCNSNLLDTRLSRRIGSSINAKQRHRLGCA